jgi:hypothetical protein
MKSKEESWKDSNSWKVIMISYEKVMKSDDERLQK